MADTLTTASTGTEITAVLPSGSSALSLVQGRPGAIGGVFLHTMLRAGLIGAGLAIAGERKHLVRNALAGSLAVEAFVLGFMWWKVRSQASP